jgi:DNA-binding transcriptional MerR regulator
MKNGLLSIGKMAEMNHVTISTLRLYDRLGLLKPRHTDPQTGYRYYDIHQNARLDMIAYMKELGMSLHEIGAVLKKEDITLIEQILSQKNEQLHEQMRGLRARHDAVECAINSIERYRKSPVTGTALLEYIDQRQIYGIPCNENFYESDMRSYEQSLLSLREALLHAGIPQIHSYHVGTSIAKENYVRGRFIAEKIFIFAGDHTKEIVKDLTTVESGMYACIYLDRYDDEIPYAQMLLEYCQDHQYRIAGDYICEVMTEFNVFDSERRSMFLRLQVPVIFGENKD